MLGLTRIRHKGEEFDLDLSDRLQAEVPSEVRDTFATRRCRRRTEKKENLEADVANMKFDAGAGEDPFMKVKGSITELINRLFGRDFV